MSYETYIAIVNNKYHILYARNPLQANLLITPIQQFFLVVYILHHLVINKTLESISH